MAGVNDMRAGWNQGQRYRVRVVVVENVDCHAGLYFAVISSFSQLH